MDNSFSIDKQESSAQVENSSVSVADIFFSVKYLCQGVLVTDQRPEYWQLGITPSEENKTEIFCF